MISGTLRHRREVIGDFEINGAFSYDSLPYADGEENMRLFAKKVAPEVKRWQPTARRQPVDIALPLPLRPRSKRSFLAAANLLS